MKKTQELLRQSQGLTLVEVLLSIIIIATSAVICLMWQKSSWSQTSLTNHLMVAGHVIEKQIEKQRMTIAENPIVNFASFIKNDSMVIVDSSVTPYIRVRWKIFAADSVKDPLGNIVQNVRKVQLTAGYGSGKGDTLKVITAISQNF
jgi:type II secretory pathway pseudopilin PulG